MMFLLRFVLTCAWLGCFLTPTSARLYKGRKGLYLARQKCARIGAERCGRHNRGFALYHKNDIYCRGRKTCAFWPSLVRNRKCFSCDFPSDEPSSPPSTKPSFQPSGKPSNQPSTVPSNEPSYQPSGKPSSQPSTVPSFDPSSQPSTSPSHEPSFHPSSQPSGKPSYQPSTVPSNEPSSQPSGKPSSQPSTVPSFDPSSQPSTVPSHEPSSHPVMVPSNEPSPRPSGKPSSRPSTMIPSNEPSSLPSSQPSTLPSIEPGASSGTPSSNSAPTLCQNGATEVSVAPSGKMKMCADPNRETCEQDFELLCPVNWKLCSRLQHNNRNDGWTQPVGSLTAPPNLVALGAIHCRSGGRGGGHFTVGPYNNPTTAGMDLPLNCGFGSSRSSCPSSFGCNEQQAVALCCVPDAMCGNGVVDGPEEECDDGNIDETDDCLNSCTWRTPSDHNLSGTGC